MENLNKNAPKNVRNTKYSTRFSPKQFSRQTLIYPTNGIAMTFVQDKSRQHLRDVVERFICTQESTPTNMMAALLATERVKLKICPEKNFKYIF